MARKKRSLNKEDTSDFETPRTLIQQVISHGDNEKTIQRERRKTRKSKLLTIEQPDTLQSGTDDNAQENDKTTVAVETSLVTPRTALHAVIKTHDVINTVKPSNRHKKLTESLVQIPDSELQELVDQESSKQLEPPQRHENEQNPDTSINEYRRKLNEKLRKLKLHTRENTSIQLEPNIELPTLPTFHSTQLQNDSSEYIETFSQKLKEKLLPFKTQLSQIEKSHQDEVIFENENEENDNQHSDQLVENISKEKGNHDSIEVFMEKENNEKFENADQSVENVSQEMKSQVDGLVKNVDHQQSNIGGVEDANMEEQVIVATNNHDEDFNADGQASGNDKDDNQVDQDDNEANWQDVVPPSSPSDEDMEDPLLVRSFHEDNLGDKPIQDATKVLMTSQSLNKSKQTKSSVKKKRPVPNMTRLVTAGQTSFHKNKKPTKRNLPVSRKQLYGIMQHYCANKVTKGAMDLVEECFEKFFKQLCHDIETMTLHGGRKVVTMADIELVMRRQRFVTDEKPLQIIIEENFPLEYRRLFIPVAGSVANKEK
uniref:centromere protein T isoform X2 n=1 Tax=Ciona intestinalis TaxID=7719 RepID=UPI000180B8ED|nr:centromere protein T isoform X2 [Ciona intestinalis]|eukprot:XP_002129976.1 centromere protein T isoform X2 [Ciona intestinalis]